MRKTLRVMTFAVLAFFGAAGHVDAQEKIVVMSQNYTYEDPRWGGNQLLEKGTAIRVYPSESEGGYEYFCGYTAASVILPKRVAHLPGTVRGERCIVVNGTNVRLREGPSTKSGIYCYDENNGSSVARQQFRKVPGVEKTEDMEYHWVPDYLPKGTRLPYLGRVGDFYKTTFDNTVFYIAAKYCLLK